MSQTSDSSLFTRLSRRFRQVVSLSGLSLSQQLITLFMVLVLTSLTLFTAVATREINSASHHHADLLGSALAQQTARFATDMLVTGDRLSLTVLLNDLVKKPYVARAAIYSIDNNRLAIAEKDDVDLNDRYITYSEPINYQEVIAGYVRIQLDEERLTQPATDATIIILALTALLLMSGVVLIVNYSRNRTRLMQRAIHQLEGLCDGEKACDESVKDEPRRLIKQLELLITRGAVPTPQPEKPLEPANSPVPALEPLPPEALGETALLAVRFRNFGKLRQCLPAMELHRLIRQQIPLVAKAAQLYGGKLAYSAEGNAFISFHEAENSDYAFNAVCCALLVRTLLGHQPEHAVARLESGTGITIAEPLTPGDTHPALADSAASKALLLASLDDDEQLLVDQTMIQTAGVTTEETTHESGIWQVTGVDEAVENLINQQCANLLGQREVEEA
ncbi:hypothetical protein [Kistimonas asteriae]|uniref:hypothetical protein n=1 Tax=Kistimonas asteriae TaxID=517724 RepID=UPI001BAB04AC|nr:hypothetical protein [Kistimonas asteriae]